MFCLLFLATYSLIQSSQSSTKPTQPQLPHIKIPTYPQSSSTSLKSGNPSSSSGSSIPLSQLLLHGPSFASGRALTTVTSTATATHILVPTSSATNQSHGYPVGAATIKPSVAAQTLVVQPLQKSSVNAGDKAGGHGNGPIPIQPKTLQGLRLPLPLPSRNPPPILPAPPSINQTSSTQPPPHIPVQIVGARQSSLGNSQALALAQARSSSSQDGAVLSSSSSLLTMVASLASREGGVMGRGAGLKNLQTPQEAPPLAHVSHVHPQAKQSPGPNTNQNCTSATATISSQSPSSVSTPSSVSRSSLSLAREESRSVSTVVPTNGDAASSQNPQVCGQPITPNL